MQVRRPRVQDFFIGPVSAVRTRVPGDTNASAEGVSALTRPPELISDDRCLIAVNDSDWNSISAWPGPVRRLVPARALSYPGFF